MAASSSIYNCIIKQLLDSVFAWYQELSIPLSILSRIIQTLVSEQIEGYSNSLLFSRMFSMKRLPGAWKTSRFQYSWIMSNNEKKSYESLASFPPDTTVEEVQEFYRKWSETYDEVSWVMTNINFIQHCCCDCSLRLHVQPRTHWIY